MRHYWTFIVIFISNFVFSQCDNIDKLKLGGTYMSKTNNYIPFEVKYRDSIYHDSVSYPNDINKIKKYSDFILSKAEDYIVTRANRSFYNKLKLYGVEVNYPESNRIKNYDDQSLYELSNFEVTYWIIYTYEKDKFRYAFGLEFNKDGKMISENKFPDYAKNKDFENLINPCNALQLVENKKRFKNKKVDFIELNYLDEKNSFCWLIQEKLDIQKLGISKYSLDMYYINANNNKLETIKKKKGSVIACGIKY